MVSVWIEDKALTDSLGPQTGAQEQRKDSSGLGLVWKKVESYSRNRSSSIASAVKVGLLHIQQRKLMRVRRDASQAWLVFEYPM